MLTLMEMVKWISQPHARARLGLPRMADLQEGDDLTQRPDIVTAGDRPDAVMHAHRGGRVLEQTILVSGGTYSASASVHDAT